MQACLTTHARQLAYSQSDRSTKASKAAMAAYKTLVFASQRCCCAAEFACSCSAAPAHTRAASTVWDTRSEWPLCICPSAICPIAPVQVHLSHNVGETCSGQQKLLSCCATMRPREQMAKTIHLFLSANRIWVAHHTAARLGTTY